MRYFIPVITMLHMSIGTLAGAAEPEHKAPINEILFERVVGDAGQRVVVVRGPSRRPALFDFWKGQGKPNSVGRLTVEQMRNIYEVRVELRTPSAEPLLLAARLRVEDEMPADKGLVILDALIEPAQILLVTAQGPDLALWKIGVGGIASHWEGLRADKQWVTHAEMRQLDEKQIGCKLTRLENGCVSLEVVEKQPGHHVLYEEVTKDSLNFKMIREWREEPNAEKKEATNKTDETPPPSPTNKSR